MILSDIIVLVNERCIKNGGWCMCMKEYIANLEKELALKIIGETTIMVENKQNIVNDSDQEIKVNTDFIT